MGVALVGRFAVRARWIMGGLAALLLAMGLVYPVTAFMTRMAERPPTGPTLDGFVFLSADDRAAIRWLSDQNQPAQRTVIAEAAGDEYSSGSKYATYSGGADVLGWTGHELQWRGPIPELSRREADLRSLYADAPTDSIRSLLDRHGVRFVIVGDNERQKYGPGVTTRFDGVLQSPVRFGSISIYRAR